MVMYANWVVGSCTSIQSRSFHCGVRVFFLTVVFSTCNEQPHMGAAGLASTRIEPIVSYENTWFPSFSIVTAGTLI